MPETKLEPRTPRAEPAPQQPKSHGLALKDRRHLAVTGVSRVISCDENTAVLETPLGNLTIGASDTVTGQFLTPYLDEFHHQHPGIRLKIVSGRSAKVVSMLRSGAVDIAFASSPKDSTLETWPCFTTHSVFVAGKNYHCDFDKIYTRQEMAEFPLILLERKASSRVFLEQEFLKAGVTLTPEIELSSRQLLVTLAGIGLGVAGVTLEFVRKDLESGDIRLLKTDFTIPERSVDMCTLKEVPPTAAATAFMEMVRRGM